MGKNATTIKLTTLENFGSLNSTPIMAGARAVPKFLSGTGAALVMWLRHSGQKIQFNTGYRTGTK
jgi:hypothetical protein